MPVMPGSDPHSSRPRSHRPASVRRRCASVCFAGESEARTAANVRGRQFGTAPADSGFEKVRCSTRAKAGVWAGELPVEELGGPHVPADEGRPDVVGSGEVILDIGELHSASGI